MYAARCETAAKTIIQGEKMKEAKNDYLDWAVYQIYPRSFYDSNGDGIGDLNGIREKIPYLKELGINAVWICPCYKSPNYDNGYDIADYRDIMDEFGTLDDWKKLAEELHKNGIKIIMDLVVNHTSSEHYWFKQARSSKNNPYHDYYIWADKPLTAWTACFGGSAWEYNAATNEYYLHSFAVQQPDLNWENPKVRQECCDVVDFWANLGVDGFRCDVLDFISKDFSANKMLNGPHLHEYIRQLFGRDEVKHLFTVGECQSDVKSICDICGKNRNELKSVFQFEHIGLGRSDKYTPAPYSGDDIKNVLVKWQNFTEKHDLAYILFTDNHDQPFFISRLGNDKELRYECATAYAGMFYLLKGIPFIYQGQEFGSANSHYNDISCFNDVETVNYYRENEHKKTHAQLIAEINYGSRDNTRRPVAWTNETKTHGFTSGTPWLKMPSRADEINLEKDRSSEKSVFVFYKKVLSLRHSGDTIKYGSFKDLTKNGGCFVYERALEKNKIVVAVNFDKPNNVILPDLSSFRADMILSNYADAEPFSESFRPFEIRVYSYTEDTIE